MNKSGTEIVEEYALGTPHDRFGLIYKYYGVFPQLIDSFEFGLYRRIHDEKEYNRRSRMTGIEELGVRVQTSGRYSNITQKEAMANLELDEVRESGVITRAFLEDTDDPEKHRRDLLTIQMMRDDYDVFNVTLKSLDPRAYRLTYKYIAKESRVEEIADEEEMACQTLRNVLYKTRKRLERDVTPSFRNRF